MESFNNVLENNKLLLTCSTDDDSDLESLCVQQPKNYCKGTAYESKEVFDIKCSVQLPSKKRNGEKRLPTRKPDPNVYNRNALLARENRKRKKIYLETIENELDAIRKANRTLTKALKRQLKIAQRLQKEKLYYEDIVKNKFKMLGLVKTTNLHQMESAEGNLNPAVSAANEDDMLKDLMDITNSRSSSLSEADNLSMLFDSASDDLYDSPDVTLSQTCTTWDDIWGDKYDNRDNIISSNVTISQHGADVQSSSVDHCYARDLIGNKIDRCDHESEQSDFVDVEGFCSCSGTSCANCYIFSTCHTPPTQLLNMESS